MTPSPKTKFYVSGFECNEDVDTDDLRAFDTIEAALEQAAEDVKDDADCIVWIYECTPVRRVHARPVAKDDLT